MTTILIVESIPLLCSAVRKVIESQGGLEVVGSFSEIGELFEIVKTKKPDWIWLDGTMPAIRSGDVPQKLKSHFPAIKLIIFGRGDSLFQIRKHYRHGAKAYLDKEESSDALENALTEIVQDKPYVSRFMLGQAATWLTKSISSHSKRIMSPLSSREMEVLKLITEECTSKEIADKLFVSPSTIETHRINLIQKLGVKNTAGLVRVAVEENLFLY